MCCKYVFKKFNACQASCPLLYLHIVFRSQKGEDLHRHPHPCALIPSAQKVKSSDLTMSGHVSAELWQPRTRLHKPCLDFNILPGECSTSTLGLAWAACCRMFHMSNFSIMHPRFMSSSNMKALTSSHRFLLLPLQLIYFWTSPGGSPCGFAIRRARALYHTRRSLISTSFWLMVLIFSRSSALKELASQGHRKDLME